MPPEILTSSAPQRPDEVFGFTKQERLSWRVNDERFRAIIDDNQTTVHTIRESSNNYGEFLFVTVSRMARQGRICMSFYGAGFHEYRERWLTEWFWYQTHATPVIRGRVIPKQEAGEILRQRREAISPYIGQDTQSERGKLFEELADLTDDDAAYVELKDLGDDLGALVNWLNNDPE